MSEKLAFWCKSHIGAHWDSEFGAHWDALNKAEFKCPRQLNDLGQHTTGIQATVNRGIVDYHAL